MAFTKTQVKFHKPVDTTDPGFTVRGMKLRWLSSYVQSRKPWRDWKVLKVSDLPKSDEVDQWKEAHPHVIDGDKIRRGDQTLAFCPVEKAQAKRKEMKEQQSVNQGSIRSKSRNKESGMVTEGGRDTLQD